MIEIVSKTRCIACDICVRACPANVFDPVPGSEPVIARQEDCQTCFLCEIYCPTDALYVAPNAEGPTPVTEAEIERAGLFGSYARARLGPGPARRQRERPYLSAARGLALTGRGSPGG